jgi:carbonic anhydrase
MPARTFPLFIEEQNKGEWLKKQSVDIQKITFEENGELLQKPFIDCKAYVDDSAMLIGGMIISKGCYVGPYAVIRLDEISVAEPLIIGENSNIQDCAVIHSTTTSIGKNVIIAHQAIVHGAVIEDNVTIYIQAVVDGGGTVIGKNSFLHQGSYIGKNIKIPPNSYVAPGEKIITQTQADSLPPVPEELIHVRANVMEHNKHHTSNYLRTCK